MTLVDIKVGTKFIIAKIENKKVRLQALRFGISEGAEIECAGLIPGGPVILKKNLQEIAIGRRTAEKIIVKEKGMVQ
jgi:ferrous iron transport protein A